MARQQLGEIRISARIARIGHQVYPLANISRVQTLRLVRRGKAAPLYPLTEIIILLLLGGGIVAAAIKATPKLHLKTHVDVVHIGHQVAIGFAVLIGIRVAWLLGVILRRLSERQAYVLMIETSGTQYTALSGTDHEEIRHIEWAIVEAIERPPAHEQVLQVSGDVVLGDKFGRGSNVHTGSGNLSLSQ